MFVGALAVRLVVFICLCRLNRHGLVSAYPFIEQDEGVTSIDANATAGAEIDTGVGAENRLGQIQYALDHLGQQISNPRASLRKVFNITVPIAGERAVLKIVRRIDPYTWDEAEIEARNTVTVKQLLGWGYQYITPQEQQQQQSRQIDSFYFLLKDMGISADRAVAAGMPVDGERNLQQEAQQRYRESFKMVHGDIHPGNYVYRQIGPNKIWTAELIDWEVAIWKGLPFMQPRLRLEPEVVDTRGIQSVNTTRSDWS